jgi:hypothetical protein
MNNKPIVDKESLELSKANKKIILETKQLVKK